MGFFKVVRKLKIGGMSACFFFFLITDGNSPINLFNTAKGLIGGIGDE
jgi:hypothetical protein